MSEYIKKEDLIRKLNAWDSKAHGIPNYAWKVINELPTYSFPKREKGTDGTLVYNADGHFYGVMGGDAIMERMRGKAE